MPSGNTRGNVPHRPDAKRLRSQKLPRSFYTGPTIEVARKLLGCYLVRRIGRSLLVGRIVEVEAYLGHRDPASHAYRGETPRNAVMFRQGGHLYVYFTYGMHFCANVVTEAEGTGNAVLLRAVEPAYGVRSMESRRNPARTIARRNLCNGPGKLCQAFAIGSDDNGTDLCGNNIWIASSEHRMRERLGVSRRIGITDGRKYLRRFYIRDSAFVSPGKPVE